MKLTEKLVNEIPFSKDGKVKIYRDESTAGLELHVGANTKTYRLVCQINQKRYNQLIGRV